MRYFLKTAALAVFMCIVSVGSAVAASKCYTPEEAAAEQGLRIHSELMVIGLNCQGMKFNDGTNLYVEYRKFTSDHSDLFSGYENTLMNYYKRQGMTDPEAKLNTLRTQLANKISDSAVRMKPDRFCNSYAGRIFQAASMDRNTLATWASTIYPSHPVSQPICEQ